MILLCVEVASARSGRCTTLQALPVMLLHAAVNNTKDVVPSAEANAASPWAPSHSLVGWLTVALLRLCAGYFLLRMRGRHVENPSPAPTYP
jgi:hypothetical protein